MTRLHLLLWAPFAAVSLHIVEEFVFPGRFLEWHRRYRPQHAASITPRFAFVMNGLLLVLCLAAVINGPSLVGVVEWLAVTAILFTNALFHIRAVLATRAYSPGALTSALLYIPLALYGYGYFLDYRIASFTVAVLSFLLGASYPLVSYLLHTFRSHAAKPPGPQASHGTPADVLPGNTDVRRRP